MIGVKPKSYPAQNKKKKWSYDGDNGPQNWGDLSADYLSCEVGLNQSPVDFSKSFSSPDLHSIRFNYGISAGRVYLARGSITFKVIPGNVAYFKGKQWVLERVVLRTPSEHSIEGHSFDGELQLYHSYKGESFLWVSVLLEAGSALKPFRQIVDKAKGISGASKLMGVDLRLLIPRRKNYYFYPGSDTIPPCKEGRSWVVLRQPVGASIKYIEHLESQVGKGARPTQPLYARVPLRYD